MSFEERIAQLMDQMARQTEVWTKTCGEMARTIESLESRVALFERERLPERVAKNEDVIRKSILDEQMVNIPSGPTGADAQRVAVAKGRGFSPEHVRSHGSGVKADAGS